jgi:hypothetical protein
VIHRAVMLLGLCVASLAGAGCVTYPNYGYQSPGADYYMQMYEQLGPDEYMRRFGPRIAELQARLASSGSSPAYSAMPLANVGGYGFTQGAETTRLRSDGFGGYRGSDGSRIKPDGFGGYRVSDGTGTTRFRSDGFGGYRGSDGSKMKPDGFGGYRVSDDTGTTRFRSDGFGGYRGSDGSRIKPDGFGGYRVREGY